MHWLLRYELTDDYLERRAPFRSEHLAHARDAHERGELLLAGALSEPADEAVLVFRTESAEPVEAFARADPYVRQGVVTSWTVRRWTVVVGAGSNDS